MEHLLVAPKCLQNKVLAMIENEIQIAKEGKPAYIGIKINSLTDKKIIDKLINASRAGVKIDMMMLILMRRCGDIWCRLNFSCMSV